MIELTGLSAVAGGGERKDSLGMVKGLGIAAALLGDPATVMLDEPVNGLDPEGVLWIRNLLTTLAAEGRTVFVSSHLMSEMALTADHLIVIGRGKLIADTSVDDFVHRASGGVVRARSPQAMRLRELVLGPDVTVASSEPGVLEISGLTAAQIGDAAAAHGIALHELTPMQASLEEAFMELTREDVEFKAGEILRDGRAGGGRGMSSSVAPVVTVPRLAVVGKVTQMRVVVSEWTKLHSLRSTRWSLLVAVVLTIGLPHAVRHHRRLALGAHAPARAREPAPARRRARRRQPVAAGDRRARRPDHHRRVLDRDDPRELHRGAEAAAGAVGQARRLRGRHLRADAAVGADRVLGQPGDPEPASHPADLVLALRRRAGRDRRRAVPRR